MPKYLKIESNEKKENKKTVFEKMVYPSSAGLPDMEEPKGWDNVMHLYEDKEYGDVFLAWDDGKEDDRNIYFGKKGDEFN